MGRRGCREPKLWPGEAIERSLSESAGSASGGGPRRAAQTLSAIRGTTGRSCLQRTQEVQHILHLRAGERIKSADYFVGFRAAVLGGAWPHARPKAKAAVAAIG